jgi:F-type H+-transporting ATPase subunit alpha
VATDKIKAFEAAYIDMLENAYKSTLNDIKAGNLSDQVVATLEKVAQELAPNYA